MDATMTREEWEAKGLALFGPDKDNWAFRCFACGNAMSVARARAEFPQLKGRGWRVESECIGRYIDVPQAHTEQGKCCDWCAYGLFCGPVSVKVEDKVVHVFAFAEPVAIAALKGQSGGA